MKIKKSTGKRVNILVIAAALLSVASIVWTTYSILDLLDIGVIALTVAATLDLIWISIQYAQHKGIPLMGSRIATEVAGWVAIAAVVGLLVWHGLTLEGQTIAGQMIDHETAMSIAVASPLLPLGAKFVTMLAASSFRDPATYTHKQQKRLDEIQRTAAYKEDIRQKREEEASATHVAMMRRMAERQEQEKKEADLQKNHELAEQQRKAAVEEAERERKRKAKEAEIENARLDAELVRMQERSDTELRIERIKNEARERMALAEGDAEVEQYVLEKRKELGRRQSFIVGETVPNQGRPQALRSVPSAPMRPSMITMSVSEMDSARKGREKLAAAFWMAKDKNPDLTAAQFAQDNGVSTSQLSRVKNEFPRSYFPESFQEEAS
jgi:flagellar biosynthesis GTPase FlhF